MMLHPNNKYNNNTNPLSLHRMLSLPSSSPSSMSGQTMGGTSSAHVDVNSVSHVFNTRYGRPLCASSGSNGATVVSGGKFDELREFCFAWKSRSKGSMTMVASERPRNILCSEGHSGRVINTGVTKGWRIHNKRILAMG